MHTIPPDDSQQSGLPGFTPSPLPVNENSDEPAKDAASEPGETNPVFGSNMQPQEILDEKIVGAPQQLKLSKGEPNVINYDPENDIRLQEPTEE